MTRIDEHTITCPPDQEARTRPVGPYEELQDVELGIRVTDHLAFMEDAHDIAFDHRWYVCQRLEAQFETDKEEETE